MTLEAFINDAKMCPGNVLEMFWYVLATVFGDVGAMCWECYGDVLAMFWLCVGGCCFGNVSIIGDCFCET